MSNKILAHTQEPVFVSCHGAGLITNETYGNVSERQYSMTAWSLTDVLPEKLLHDHISNLTARPVSFWNLMIVAYVSSALTCVTHAKGDESYMLKEEDQIQMNWGKFNSDPTIIAVRYKTLERRDE